MNNAMQLPNLAMGSTSESKESLFNPIPGRIRLLGIEEDNVVEWDGALTELPEMSAALAA